ARLVRLADEGERHVHLLRPGPLDRRPIARASLEAPLQRRHRLARRIVQIRGDEQSHIAASVIRPCDRPTRRGVLRAPLTPVRAASSAACSTPPWPTGT